MIYCEDEVAGASFKDHLRNIPYIENETDTARYLRAFEQMLAEAPPTTADQDWIADAAKDAIRVASDDAFRRGFEVCQENVVEPLRGTTIATSDAEAALRRYGERVGMGISALFEEGPGVPTQLSEDIYELPLPPTKGIFQ